MISNVLRDALTTKFDSYTMEQCEFALGDISETIRLLGHEGGDYLDKLVLERELARARIQTLNRAAQTKGKTIAKILAPYNILMTHNEIFDLASDTIVEIAEKAYDAGRKSRG